MAILVERDHIGIFGKMNAGKSTLMNLLTQQETSIVDAAPGTTADTKTTLMELHGMGPVKVFDTAGIDERTSLGQKKRRKVFNDLKECDLTLIIINPKFIDLSYEKDIIRLAREADKQVLVIYNIFNASETKNITKIESKYPVLKFYKKLQIDLLQPECRQNVIKFVLDNFISKNIKLELLPFIEKYEYYILVIPMDTETPQGRYLRPQAMAEEYITRNWAYPISFRLDLSKARSKNPKEKAAEKNRFLSFIENSAKKPKAIITDSQAMDVMYPWCPKDILLTTFSITMINYISKDRLSAFAQGIKYLDKLKKGDKVLIAEACNHSRIGEDIGTVQIPAFFKKDFPGVKVEFNFGREFEENKHLLKYKLIIHCGGCLISPQKLAARIRDLDSLKIPYTNYGLFLSNMQGKKALSKVLEPWKINI